MLKVKLLCDLPVGKEHGMTKGRVLEVSDVNENADSGHVRWWVWGDDEQEIGVFGGEAEPYADEGEGR